LRETTVKAKMRPMLRAITFLAAAILTLITTRGYSGVMNYQGRVSVDGNNFNGQGYFVFSLHDTNGMILWSSGDFPLQGSTNLPRAVWRLPVRDGVYNVRLGDTNAGMPSMDLGRVLAANDPFLRVWFTDGKRGWQAAGGDTPVKAALKSKSPGKSTAVSGAVISGNQADVILKELRDLRTIVQKLPAQAATPVAPEKPLRVTLPLGGSPVLGAATAPLVLVEFTDYQCSFCKRAHDQLIPELKRKYVETGKLRFVSRNLPLHFHPNAEPAAIAALCAGSQNQYWAMRDKLFAVSTNLTRASFLQAASELGLNTESFSACLDGTNFARQIIRDKTDAEAAGITGTPTFVLGRQSGEKVTGLLIVGSRPLAQFEAEIAKQLAKE
jgi:protein-disulfide isomerase